MTFSHFSATIPVTLNAGFRMPAWFDIYSLDRSGQQDEAGILKATENGTILDKARQCIFIISRQLLINSIWSRWVVVIQYL